MNTSPHFNDLESIPAAACGLCGGWTPYGGCSQHRAAVTPQHGRTGCTCFFALPCATAEERAALGRLTEARLAAAE